MHMYAAVITLYLSMIAHMSRLTFSKAPTVPFSTACISAGWSSTRIACMHPWNERWEGGNNVCRKYPETNTRNKQKHSISIIYIYIHLFSKAKHRQLEFKKIQRIRVGTETKECIAVSLNNEVKLCGKNTVDSFDLQLKRHHENRALGIGRHKTKQHRS